MKVTKAVQKISTYQLHSEKTSRIHYISSIENASFDPVPVTPCSTRESYLRPVCRRLTYSPSDADVNSEDEVPLPHCMPKVQHHIPEPWALSSKHTLNAYIYLEEEDDEGEDFQTVFWMMNIGPPKKFLTDHYVYMNICYLKDYAHTCVHMQTIKLLLTLRPWIWVTFPNSNMWWPLPVMTTSLQSRILHTEKTVVRSEHSYFFWQSYIYDKKWAFIFHLTIIHLWLEVNIHISFDNCTFLIRSEHSYFVWQSYIYD